jgi:hypothetical protein
MVKASIRRQIPYGPNHGPNRLMKDHQTRRFGATTGLHPPPVPSPKPGCEPTGEAHDDGACAADISAFGWSTSGSSATGSSAAKRLASTAGASSPSSQHRDLVAAGLRLTVNRSTRGDQVDWWKSGRRLWTVGEWNGTEHAGERINVISITLGSYLPRDLSSLFSAG